MRLKHHSHVQDRLIKETRKGVMGHPPHKCTVCGDPSEYWFCWVAESKHRGQSRLKRHDWAYFCVDHYPPGFDED